MFVIPEYNTGTADDYKYERNHSDAGIICYYAQPVHKVLVLGEHSR